MRSYAAALLCLLPFGIGAAQVQAINGSIRGRVTDPGGAGVPQATVTAANNETGFSRPVDSDNDGYYVIPNLPLGTYTVGVQKAGFETERHTNVVLNAGTEAVIDAQLKLGAVSTTIEVTGGAPVVDPSRVSTGRTIGHAEVDNLPLTSRNPYNFVLFQPGVSGHPNPELGIPRTINTNGLLDRINYQMDGMVDTEKDRYGLRLFPISDIYVREVQTVSNSFAPEFGQTAGNIYNVITNSGTNTFHGEFSFIGRPPGAQARPILLNASQPAPNTDLHDYAVNAGGPMIKDRLFVFGGYEHLLRGLPVPNTINPASAAQLGIAPDLLATAPSVQHAQFLNIRADWIINSKNQAFFRYNYFRNEYPFNTNVGGLFALDAAADFRDRAHIGGAQLLTTFSPAMLNELRGSWPYRNEAHIAGSTTGPGPQVVVSGVATFNGSVAVGDKFSEKVPSLNDNFTWVRGVHTIKIGGGFERILDNQVGDVYSQYTFPTIAAYLAAENGSNPFSYSSFKTVIGVPGATYKPVFWNFFAQDSWQMKPNLLVIYGVRYDQFRAPEAEPDAPFVYTRSFKTPNNDWGPRLGFAWSLDSKTVIRASSGIFFEAPPTNLWFNALNNDGSSRSFQATFLPTQPGAPAFPSVFHLLPGVTPTNPGITAVTPNFKNAYGINSTFQITREFTRNDAVTAGYVHNGVRQLQYLHNINLGAVTGLLGDGRPVFGTTGKPFPQFNTITLQDVGAITNYDALLVNWTHRLSRGIVASASYTWSHSISDSPDVNSFEQNLPIQDPTSRFRDRGNSIVNRPQAFTLSSVFAPEIHGLTGWKNQLANGNQLALLANISSGDQQNIVANAALNGDPVSAAVQRPLAIGRNTVRGPAIYQIDARYTRVLFTFWERVQPKFLAEATNVFNTKNITTLNTTVAVNADGSPKNPLPASFPPTSTVLEGRIIQLGIRVDW